MKNLLTEMSTKLMNSTGKFGLRVQKNAPEIMMGAGILGIIGTVVLACKATLKAGDVLDSHREGMDAVDEMEDLGFSKPEEIRKEKAIVYVKTTGDFAKLYGPSVAVGTLSISLILCSNNLLRRRYLGAVAAYNAVSGAFDLYRGRVREEMGEDADRRFLYGERTEKLEVFDETGKKKKEEIRVIDGEPSGYARFFDSTCINWNEDPTMSLMFLKAQQEIASHILNVRGHIFLNEVYDMLGFSHTQAGAIVGWVKGLGDSYVDFGLYEKSNDSARKFINGYDNVILLDFNVDGVIYDKI